METSMDERAARFVKNLLSCRNNRAAMASFRRSLSKTQEHLAWPYLAPVCNIASDRLRTVAVCVAAAYAFNPNMTEKVNFGDQLRLLAMRDGGFDTFERHIRSLIRPIRVELVCKQIPNLARRMSNNGVPINYDELFRSLTYWGDRGKYVRAQWASSYYGGEYAD